MYTLSFQQMDWAPVTTKSVPDTFTFSLSFHSQKERERERENPYKEDYCPHTIRKDVGSEKLSNLPIVEFKPGCLRKGVLKWRPEICNYISSLPTLSKSFLTILVITLKKKLFLIIYPQPSLLPFRYFSQLCDFNVIFLVDDSPSQTDLLPQFHI